MPSSKKRRSVPFNQSAGLEGLVGLVDDTSEVTIGKHLWLLSFVLYSGLLNVSIVSQRQSCITAYSILLLQFRLGSTRGGQIQVCISKG